MNLEELRERSRELLERARKELLRDNNLTPQVLLADASDGSGLTHVVVDGRLMNDPAAKKAFSAKVRALVDQHGYVSALFISDTWTAKEMTFEESAAMDALRKRLHCDLVTACQIMNHPMQEAILVLCQTLGPCLMIRQIYHRAADGKVLRFEEPRETETSPDGIRGLMWFLCDRTRRVDVEAQP